MNLNRCLRHVVLLALLSCLADGVIAESYLTTPRPTVLFSVNDGEALSLLDEGPDAAVPADSVTVIRLYPDRPPTSKTVAGTITSTIEGSPYSAIIGRFGIVTNHTYRGGPRNRLESVRGNNRIAVVDVLSDDLAVTDRIDTESAAWQAAAHPDGHRVIVSFDDQWRVFDVTPKGKLEEIARTPTSGIVWSFALSPDGKSILAAMTGDHDYNTGVGRIVRFDLNPDSSLAGPIEIESNGHVVDGPNSPRFAPDGKSALILNGDGWARGMLHDALMVDMETNRVVAVVPQLGDGLESLAYHPSGDFAVIACLNSYGGTFFSQLAVIDLTSGTPQLLYHLPVERTPQGLEFTPDGSMLFVGTSDANQIAVFDVKGNMLNRSPFVLPTGYGPSVMGLSTY